MVALNDQQISFMVFMTVRVLNSTGPAKAITHGVWGSFTMLEI